MSENLLSLINTAAQLAILLPLFSSFFRFKKLERVRKLVVLLLAAGTLISGTAFFLWYKSINNLPLLHLYTIVEYVGWAAVFHQLFEQVQSKKIIITTSLFFISFAILNSNLWQNIYQFNSYSRSAEALILLGFSLAYFIKLFKEKNTPNLEYFPFFWINSAALLYFSGSFLLFGFSNLLLQLNSYAIKEVWAFHGIFLIAHYILITIGLWMKLAEKKFQ